MTSNLTNSCVSSFIKNSETALYSEYKKTNNHFYLCMGSESMYNKWNNWKEGNRLCDQSIAKCEEIMQNSKELICSNDTEKNQLHQFQHNITHLSNLFKREKAFNQLNSLATPTIFGAGIITLACLAPMLVCITTTTFNLNTNIDCRIAATSFPIASGTGMVAIGTAACWTTKFLKNQLDSIVAHVFMKRVEMQQEHERLTRQEKN